MVCSGPHIAHGQRGITCEEPVGLMLYLTKMGANYNEE